MPDIEEEIIRMREAGIDISELVGLPLNSFQYKLTALITEHFPEDRVAATKMMLFLISSAKSLAQSMIRADKVDEFMYMLIDSLKMEGTK